MSNTFIHPSAVVEEGVELGLGCHIGPFCHVGKDVSLGDRVVLKSHVVVTGRTDIGDDSTVFLSRYWEKFRRIKNSKASKHVCLSGPEIASAST